MRKESANQHAFQILEALLVFNKHVLKCNFYQPTSMFYRISSQSSTDFLQRSPSLSDWTHPSCQRSNTPRSLSACSLLSEPTSEVSTSDSGMSLEVVSESFDLEERSKLIFADALVRADVQELQLQRPNLVRRELRSCRYPELEYVPLSLIRIFG
jgi:hypothetical protein